MYMGILKIKKYNSEELIDVVSYTEYTNEKGTKSLIINDDYVLRKNDDIVFRCDDSGEIYIQKFRFKDKWFSDRIVSYKQARKETNINKYGVENVYQSNEVKNKIKKTWLNKYGVDNPQKSKEIKKKTAKTNMVKYGVDNPWKNEAIKKKIRDTNIEKYGKNYFIESDAFKDLSNISKIEKHGDKNYNNKIKRSETCIKKYGLKWYVETEDFKNQAYKTKKENGTLYRSKVEIEIGEYIENFGIEIETNERKIIYPYEIDIYLPKYRIGIEVDGLYWHSEEMGKGRYYHINKTVEANNNNIKLIHIFEDEWIHKKDVVKNRLRNILGFNSRRIGGRKTIIKEIDSKTKNQFLEEYHIQGADKSNIKLGAFYNNELVGVMTFRKLQKNMGYKKNNNILELSRFTTIGDTFTPGLASKMLEYFKRNFEWTEIISYSDIRWNTGDLYKKIGFEYDGKTEPNYWYVLGNKRFYRYQFRKSQLTNFDNYDVNKTEKQIMSETNYFKIWDCGNYRFKLKNIVYV